MDVVNKKMEGCVHYRRKPPCPGIVNMDM